MLSRKLFLVFMACCLWYSVYCLYSVNKYMKAVDVPVEVKQIYSGTSSGKHSRMEFIAIYQAPDGYIFDRHISAANFYQLQPGDKITLNLRPFDLKQTSWENAVWYFGASFYYLFASAAGIIFVALAFWPRALVSEESFY